MPAPVNTSPTFASAMSDVADTDAAAGELLYTLTKTLGEPRADLVILFATPHHTDGFAAACDRIAEALNPRVILGCTHNGVIGVKQEWQDGPGISALAGIMPGALLKSFSYEQIDIPAVLDAPAALRSTIHFNDGPANTDAQPRAIFLFADPFSTPMVRLLPAFNEAFGPTPVLGGMASGAVEPGRNRLVLDGQAMRDGAVGVAIAGDIDIQTTVSQGCRPVGEPLVITKSHRHIVQSLGGRNPLLVMRELAADLSREDRELIQTNGLHVGRVINEYKSRFGRGDFLIRNMVGVDAEEGFIAIGDTRVRTGQTIQFHLRDAKSAEDDLRMMLNAQRVHGRAAGALLLSCTGRGVNLFNKPHADAQMVHDALGPVPLAGAFCAGEIGPIADQNHLHGHTACLAVFRGRV